MKITTKLVLLNIVLVSIIAFFAQNHDSSSPKEEHLPTKSIEVLPKENEKDSQKKEMTKSENSGLKLVNDDSLVIF